VKASRRDFLKVSGLALAGLMLPPTLPDEAPRQVQSLGRAVKTIGIYDGPSPRATSVRLMPGDTVFDIYANVLSDDDNYNRTWYETSGGYVYSGQVQPVRWELQPPLDTLPSGGFLGEVTVPLTALRTNPHPKAPALYNLYYGTTYWVTHLQLDAQQAAWYEIYDEITKRSAWVQAEHLRQVLPEELTPLSPDVSDKRIEIQLAQQTFQCFEGSQKVLDTLCSTGIYLRTEQGRRIYGTPAGHWAVMRKRPSRHMVGGDLAAADLYDLPGVPWVSYFHWWGASIHGTYWHNDYGKPHSHGCINLPIDVAKWVFRWSLPVAGLDRKETVGKGTPVIVI
jgi:hypothetical protein